MQSLLNPETVGERSPGKLPGQGLDGFAFVRSDRRYHRIAFRDLYYLESRKNYVRIVTTRETITVWSTLKDFMTVLPSPYFARIHRSFVIGLHHLQTFDFNTVSLPNITLPIGEMYSASFMASLPIVMDRRNRTPMKEEIPELAEAQ